MRNNKLVFGFLFGLAVIANLLVAVESSPSTNELKWGEPVGELQMSGFLEKDALAVHCWIRNAGTKAITYNDYCLGYCASVVVMDKNGTRGLTRGPEMRPLLSAGPSPYDNKQLGPSGFIPRGRGYSENYSSVRNGKWLLNTNAPESSAGQGGNQEVLRPPSMWHDQGATIVVDLLDFQWPDDLLTNADLTLTITQCFPPVLTNYYQSILSPQQPWFSVTTQPIHIDGKRVGAILTNTFVNRSALPPWLKGITFTNTANTAKATNQPVPSSK